MQTTLDTAYTDVTKWFGYIRRWLLNGFTH